MLILTSNHTGSHKINNAIGQVSITLLSWSAEAYYATVDPACETIRKE